MDWSRRHVHSTVFVCWGAQAALYHFYGVGKRPLGEKMFGVFPHRVLRRDFPLFRGFDDTFFAPHSRHTESDPDAIESHPDLTVLARSDEAGIFVTAANNGREIFISGHPEYDPCTLEREYLRDKNLGLPILPPANYYPNDDDTQEPHVTWRAHANLLYSNWLNYYVYQTTPYNVSDIADAE